MQQISHKSGHQRGKDLGLLIWYQQLHLSVDLTVHIVMASVFLPHSANTPKTNFVMILRIQQT